MMPVITLKIITGETKLEEQHLDNGNPIQHWRVTTNIKLVFCFVIIHPTPPFLCSKIMNISNNNHSLSTGISRSSLWFISCESNKRCNERQKC